MDGSRLAALGLLCISLIGCEDARTTHRYCPLSDGARWEYAMTTTGPSGEPVKGRLVSLVQGSRKINGNRYSAIRNETVSPGGSESSIVYFRSTEEGIFFFKGVQLDHPEQPYLPAAPRIGDTWIVETPTSKVRNQVASFGDAGFENGRYGDCLKVTSNGTILSGRDTMVVQGSTYYAEGVGQVKSEFMMHSSSGEVYPILIILENYTKGS